jgi:hypothetical protein
MKKLGRPPIPASKRLSWQMPLRVTPAVLRKLRIMATRGGYKSVSAMVRSWVEVADAL